MNIGRLVVSVAICDQILENDETIDHPQPDGDGIRVGEDDSRAAKKSV